MWLLCAVGLATTTLWHCASTAGQGLCLPGVVGGLYLTNHYHMIPARCYPSHSQWMDNEPTEGMDDPLQATCATNTVWRARRACDQAQALQALGGKGLVAMTVS